MNAGNKLGGCVDDFKPQRCHALAVIFISFLKAKKALLVFDADRKEQKPSLVDDWMLSLEIIDQIHQCGDFSDKWTSLSLVDLTSAVYFLIYLRV
jgi:hypothetical protein